MNRVESQSSLTHTDTGFTLIEVLVALTITLIVMAAVFGLLVKGQETFEREPEVADLNQSIRVGLDRVARDLSKAGYNTPPAIAVQWNAGGGITPDELTIIYGDSLVPTAAVTCKNGNCRNIERSSVMYVDLNSIDPKPLDPELAFSDGMILTAIETSDCNGDGQVGLVQFEITGDPKVISGADGPVLKIIHNPGGAGSGINNPGGFNREVDPNCAQIGRYQVIQYRVNPLPPDPNPALERRDLSTGEDWQAVAGNIENFQVLFGVGSAPNFVEVPATPNEADPNTWITRVKVTVAGRTESRNLQGSSQGVFAAEDTHLRNTISTTVSLRNLLDEASNRTAGLRYN